MNSLLLQILHDYGTRRVGDIAGGLLGRGQQTFMPGPGPLVVPLVALSVAEGALACVVSMKHRECL